MAVSLGDFYVTINKRKIMTKCVAVVNEKSPNYECIKCNYKCSKLSEWNRHELTRKHKLVTNSDIKIATAIHVCACGYTYKHRQGLSFHRKTCTINIEALPPPESLPPPQHEPAVMPNTTDTSVIIKLLKQNDDFKTLMVEQYTQLQETNKQNIELQRQLVDAVKNNANAHTIVNHNNTTNNHTQKFNLNFFLNDTCKDAMSITDFLRNLNVHIDELEYIGNHGYVNGMTKMIMDRLKDMDITKRPIHCTDIKRETMYIKDDAGWSKDTDELTKLRKILSRISMNNYRTVPVWRTAHPDCEVMETRTYEFCYKMMRAILGDVEEEQIRLDNKIIKTLAKELFVQK
jgi:hypothetical protein